jgi:hypothetical protein
MAKIKRVYGIGQPFEDIFPIPVISSSAPTSSDTGFNLGQVWIRNTTDQAYILTSVAAGSAVWTLAAPGASDVDTLTGDSGGAISPSSGDIILAGGTNITSAGAGATITFNLDAAITLSTSITSALYTTAAATDLLITAVSSQDVIMKLSDNAGAQKFSITDSDDAEVFSVDSNGGQTYTTITASGLITANASMTVLTAGTALNLGSDNNSAAVNLGVGTTARAIGIGNSAAAHTITIGSVTGAASLDLLAGTGDYSIDGAATTDMLIGASLTSGIISIGGTAQTGTMTLGDSSGTNIVQIGSGEGATTVNIAGGATNAKAVNIGIGAIGNVIAIGSASAASSLDLLVGTGNYTLNGAATSTYTVGAATTSGTISIGGTAQTGIMTLGDSSGTNIVQIGSGEGATTLNLAGGATNAKVVNIAIGAVANLVTMGSASGAASMDLLCGTGNFTLEGATASTYEISSTGVNTGTCKFASGTGARTVEIAGGGTGIKTINIGAAATADVITIGSTTAAGATTIAAGTGDITLSGTVKEVNSEYAYSTGTDLQVQQSPVCQSNATTGAAPTGSAGDINLMMLQDGCQMEQFIIGTQTIIAPRMSANGLSISLDATNTEGAEYNFGARANAKHAYTIGTSAAFEFEATLYPTTMAGLLHGGIGFRKVEANNATFGSYTDYVFIGLVAASSGTVVYILDELNGTGITATSTTDNWGGDATAQTVKILVSASGVVTFEVGGSAAGVAPSFTFDNADVVMPFIRSEQNATTTAEFSLQAMKIGFQA